MGISYSARMCIEKITQIAKCRESFLILAKSRSMNTKMTSYFGLQMKIVGNFGKQNAAIPLYLGLHVLETLPTFPKCTTDLRQVGEIFAMQILLLLHLVLFCVANGNT